MNDRERNEAEWAFAQIVQNPVLFREFINEGNSDWSKLEDHERAWTSCRAPYLCMCCGRGVRKTTTMIEMLYYWAINKMYIPGDPGLLVYVPNKAQKDSIWPRIRQACEKHWLMSKIVDSNGINEQVGRIKFLNGFELILRIAGSENKESNVISVHGARIWVDEAQDFPWRAWQSLDNVLKFDVPWHMLWVSGVPNGERKENVLFSCDFEDDKYISFNIPQTSMSWWTPELEFERRKRYKAIQEDSEDYKHYVLGQHGVPTYAIFDRVRFAKTNHPVQITVLTQHAFESTKRIDPDGVVRYHLSEALSDCPPLPAEYGVRSRVGIGWDVGYSPDPSVFFIMYYDSKVSGWKCLTRVILQRVEYTLQRETLLWLDKIYNFDFIGIDMGGVGKVVYQELTSELADESYLKQHYSARIFPVEFGGRMTVALQDENGKVVEKKDLVKRVGVETVSRWVHEHTFIFSEDDLSLMDELERTKFSRNPSGEPVYRTENDHQFSAMMCAVLAFENRFGVPLAVPKVEARPKLMSARFVDVGNVIG